ncbi:helicase-like transcription factor CHR28 isoform X1 [Lycium barbarum]|uniref:helicase-like transcription factor CHR28 isoform X1 n=1 Tax=Lycium barbarum TaxID=112863 RepID=UPI00293E0923|nr:helicase-like transcription factor CHR28 isoform X1 [Lycium barbarum]
MMMADKASSELWLSSEETSVDFDLNFDGPSMDLDDLLSIIDEKSDPPIVTTQQSMPEDLLPNDVGQVGYSDLERSSASRAQFLGHIGVSPSSNSEASDTRTGVSDGSSDSAGNSIVDGKKLGFQLEIGSPLHSFYESLTGWTPAQDNEWFSDRDNISRSTSSNVQQERLLLSQSTAQNKLNNSGTLAAEETASMEVAVSSNDEHYARLSLCQSSDTLPGNWDNYAQTPHTYSFLKQDAPNNLDFEMLSHNDKMLNVMDEQLDHTTGIADSDTGIACGNWTTRTGEGIQRAPECHMTPNFGVGELSAYYSGSDQTLLNSGNLFSRLEGSNTMGKIFPQPLPCNQSSFLFQNQQFHRKNDKSELIGGADMSTVSELSNSFCSAPVTSLSSNNLLVYPKDENDVLQYNRPSKLPFSNRNNRPSYHLDNLEETSLEKPILVPHDQHVDVKVREQSVPLSSTSMKQRFGCAKLAKGEKRIFLKVNGSCLSTITHQGIKRSSLNQISHSEDDDDDLCILEEISAPAKANPCANGKSLVALQRTTITDSFAPAEVGQMRPEVGQMRPKSNDELVIYRAALQDLSQPKSEESPPDGLLAVPLLRHQRIALSWMAKKEKAGVPCCGGILADDQGLGKTVSTIALILKERSPSSRLSTAITRQIKTETLNLDDDDVLCELDKSKQGADSCQVDENSSMGCKTSLHAKGRPAAGTLVVCPTSVLRQWSEELHNKVTSKANLSVLVYHGSSRTKDPIELAKYDVVVTTYSIVSMEVPKQPLAEDDDETGKATHESSSSKKRKTPSSSKKSSSKAKKEMEKELLEATARPLARVGWYRVVLDEAQSIKNYRTQVARACWGLRAKRRWCLSGTPIQNAVDDLYSYFRFLKYDPYAVYKQFCSTIKVPIQRHPTTGYRKLQAVLKTVMLRRTKGTFIDGEPIINLPKKTIVLKKVDFTDEERDFYCRLEAESRAQFAEYAAAGTVKQNYVNILLMLLRLRQACDHPLLVGGSNSGSVWRLSVEEAKKLSREKLTDLLNCLEGSLAICGICSDPPEDAVVTVCGHVFCNQCICEHLTGDDTQCPVSACKAHLSGSSVFTKAMLSGSLSDQPSLQKYPDCAGSQVAESSICSPYDSSKIKAALQVLQSLSKPKACNRLSRSDDEGASPSENTCDISSKDTTTTAGEKAIVFSQWTGMLDLLEACLKTSSIQYRRLDGTMSVLARDKAVKDFNTLPEVTVMIMSLKAASLGLNMVAACHVLLLDLWWNPTTEDQAIDRAHRIGQTRPVTVLRLTVKDTVEDRILALQQKKREMVASAFGEDETGSRQTRLTVEDLEYLFKI